MKILLLDHAFHERTHSTKFFFDELRKHGNVTIALFDPEQAAVEIRKLQAQIAWTSYDLVVIFQLEALALLPLSYGVPTLICPMYDACGGQPREHWVLFEESALLNFSLNLHMTTRAFVPRQKLVKYFPDPSLYKPVHDFASRRVLFWRRRPEEIDISNVLSLLQDGFEHLHIHLAADNADAPPAPPDLAATGAVSTSTWFESRADFVSVLDRCNVMICPRQTEGIGMTMIEAMARGMCVIAHSAPTHNEYIAHGINGLLFDKSDFKPLDLRHFAEMGVRARQTVVRGHLQWRLQMEQLSAFLREICENRPSPIFDPETAEALLADYFVDPNRYLKSASNLYPRSRHARSNPAAGELHRMRRLANLLPGWSRLKAVIPSSVKGAVAKRLGRLFRF